MRRESLLTPQRKRRSEEVQRQRQRQRTLHSALLSEATEAVPEVRTNQHGRRRSHLTRFLLSLCVWFRSAVSRARGGLAADAG